MRQPGRRERTPCAGLRVRDTLQHTLPLQGVPQEHQKLHNPQGMCREPSPDRPCRLHDCQFSPCEPHEPYLVDSVCMFSWCPLPLSYNFSSLSSVEFLSSTGRYPLEISSLGSLPNVWLWSLHLLPSAISCCGGLCDDDWARH